MLVGNTAAAILGFFVSWITGIRENIFITQNMVNTLFIVVVLLLVYTSLMHYAILLHRTTSETVFLDDPEEDIEDISESTPLLDSHDILDAKASVKKLAFSLLLLLSLVLILASVFPLLMYQFNTCPPFPYTENANIKCNETPQTYGSTCRLICSPLFWSSSSLHSSCSLRGVWSVTGLTCRPQVAAVVGSGWNTLGKWVPTIDIYPPTGSRSPLPGLPILLGKVEI